MLFTAAIILFLVSSCVLDLSRAAIHDRKHQYRCLFNKLSEQLTQIESVKVCTGGVAADVIECKEEPLMDEDSLSNDDSSVDSVIRGATLWDRWARGRMRFILRVLLASGLIEVVSPHSEGEVDVKVFNDGVIANAGKLHSVTTPYMLLKQESTS